MQTEAALEETTFSFSRTTPRPGDRRRESRHMTILRVGTLIVDGARELCLIRNISAGGAMVHVYSKFRLGQRVAVELRAHQANEGTVTWLEDANIGIEFDEGIDVEEMLAQQSLLDNGWRPRLPRVEVDCMATLRVGAIHHWVAARDISQGGVKVETDQSLEPGTDVVVTLDRFHALQGVVRWCANGQAGVSFNQVVPFRDLMDWLKREQKGD